jgi:peptidylprolyl isomerase
VKNGWIQTGDILLGSGKKSICSFGVDETVPDESFSVDFDFLHGGIVAYANTGAHSSRSQFFITLGPCNWMNNKYQGFGRVIQGFNTLKKFNKIVVSNNTPINTVRIARCSIAPELSSSGKS